MDTLQERQSLRAAAGTYDLRLDAAGNVQAVATVRGEPLPARDEVVFALSPGVAVTRVEVDGVPARVRADGDGVWSVPAARSPDHAARTVRVEYEGHLDRAFMRDDAGDGWYELQFMTRWRPVFGFAERLRSRVAIRVPASFRAVSSYGLAEEWTDAADARYRWDTGQARSEDFALVVGEGSVEDLDEGPLRLRALCQREPPHAARSVLSVAAHALRIYAAAWGTCPHPRITLACLPHSACGNCCRDGLVLFGQIRTDPSADPGAFRLLAHELSHMWWGIGVRFDEAWSLGYEEALANYAMERLARDRFGEEAFRAHLGTVLLPHARAAEAAAGVSLRECRYDTPDSGGLRWAKGACVMLLLERLIGRGAMDAALSGLFAAFAGRRADPADVRQAFVAAGGAGVERFFDDHFDGTVPIPAEPEAYGG